MLHQIGALKLTTGRFLIGNPGVFHIISTPEHNNDVYDNGENNWKHGNYALLIDEYDKGRNIILWGCSIDGIYRIAGHSAVDLVADYEQDPNTKMPFKEGMRRSLELEGEIVDRMDEYMTLSRESIYKYPMVHVGDFDTENGMTGFLDYSKLEQWSTKWRVLHDGDELAAEKAIHMLSRTGVSHFKHQIDPNVAQAIEFLKKYMGDKKGSDYDYACEVTLRQPFMAGPLWNHIDHYATYYPVATAFSIGCSNGLYKVYAFKVCAGDIFDQLEVKVHQDIQFDKDEQWTLGYLVDLMGTYSKKDDDE